MRKLTAIALIFLSLVIWQSCQSQPQKIKDDTGTDKELKEMTARFYQVMQTGFAKIYAQSQEAEEYGWGKCLQFEFGNNSAPVPCEEALAKMQVEAGEYEKCLRAISQKEKGAKEKFISFVKTNQEVKLKQDPYPRKSPEEVIKKYQGNRKFEGKVRDALQNNWYAWRDDKGVFNLVVGWLIPLDEFQIIWEVIDSDCPQKEKDQSNCRWTCLCVDNLIINGQIWDSDPEGEAFRLAMGANNEGTKFTWFRLGHMPKNNPKIAKAKIEKLEQLGIIGKTSEVFALKQKK